MMMKMSVMLLASAMMLLVAVPAKGQVRQKKSLSEMFAAKSKKKNITSSKQEGKVTQSMLQQAIRVVYSEDSGSLPPEYQWQYTITVTKSDVRLTITTGYRENKPYDKRVKISSGQYQDFVSTLAEQNVRKVKPREDPLDGGSSSSIKVVGANGLLFQGEDGYDLTLSGGHLSSAFHLLLTQEMKNMLSKVTE